LAVEVKVPHKGIERFPYEPQQLHGEQRADDRFGGLHPPIVRRLDRCGDIGEVLDGRSRSLMSAIMLGGQPGEIVAEKMKRDIVNIPPGVDSWRGPSIAWQLPQ
jgi:hypothetical protein